MKPNKNLRKMAMISIIFLPSVLFIVPCSLGSISTTRSTTGRITRNFIIDGNNNSSIFDSNPDLRDIVKGNNEFALELYSRIKDLPEIEYQEGNLFFSPYSISSSIAMAYMGARSNTAKEIANIMHFPSIEAERIASGFSDFQNYLETNSQAVGYQLNIANALWGQQGYGILPEYLEINRKYFGSGFKELDFAKSEEARKTINKWVEQQTKEKIKDLFPAGAIDPVSTRLILTDAIYFKGAWVLPFKEEDTKPAEFNVTKEKIVQVQMMYQKKRYKYSQVDDIQLLQIPYGLDALSQQIIMLFPDSYPEASKLTQEQRQKLPMLSMLIILPSKIDGLDSLEKKLNRQTFESYIAQMKEDELEIYLPKFKMTCGTIELKNILIKMGMKDAFSGAADFSGINGKKELFIDKVLHKTFVEVNEKGTEAAAASGLRVLLGMKLTPPPVFKADRPFLFIIMDNKTKSILFMGRVVNPAIDKNSIKPQ
jgi:serine protease inhibitor